MTRINLFRATTVRSTTLRTTPTTLDSVAWGKNNSGKTNWGKTNFDKNASTLVFAALLIVCSLAVGCSSEKPKTETSTNQSAITPPMPPVVTPATPALPLQAAVKPVHKKVVRKTPVTVTYADKTSGISFQYPRKYALETGNAANELVSSDPLPMDFVQPGGVALAAVAVPESVYPNSDLASAFFGVSVNKELTAEQCGEFFQTKTAGSDPAAPTETAASVPEPSKLQASKLESSKLMIGDMELQSSETLASQGTREVASKYYHIFENGACYEFALKVATSGIENQGGATHVDREKVFQRLEKILATVKIDPVAAPEVTASAPETPSATETPAQ
jgi:hypothetical protein